MLTGTKAMVIKWLLSRNWSEILDRVIAGVVVLCLYKLLII